MLLRDLNWVPREAQHYWDCWAAECREGTLYVEQRHGVDYYAVSIGWMPGISITAQQVGDGQYELSESTWHHCDDELEAQGVFDHYVTTYSALLPEVTDA